jgi:RNA polymerase sigma-70 factor (ECF subfamily)
MALVEDRERWVALVVAARAGDAAAWPALIDRFEDIVLASAIGLCGDLDEAPDVAQEAFVLAFQHVGDLDDPAAFPAWLLRLVRTATNRRARRRRLATVPLEAASGDNGPHGLADPAAEPDEVVVAAVEAAEVRAAVELLPEGERCVVALHHLAGLPYAEVATFLGITVSAAKKRGWSARARLKELLPMVADALAAARPSGTEVFRDTVLLFQAIRVRDVEALARVLARNPLLAAATEDWSPVEGFESRLGFSERASALIRAAGTGDIRLVRLLVEAGAPVADLCPCVDHESALVTAVNIGASDVVDYLLEHGAPVDAGAFDGDSTALHVAVHRERHDLVRRLLAAGADPAAIDAHGRTAADWSALKAARRPAVNDGDVLWTRIRAIDLFAPLRRGALVHIPPAYGLGAMRALFGMVDALTPAHWWMIGFEHGPYEPVEFERETRDSGTPATIDLIGPGHLTDRRRRFAASLDRLADAPGGKVVTCVPAPGHEHDITVGLPGLVADVSVLVTVVVAPYSSEPPPIPESLPEGFDARITFDPARAKARLWPAIDPDRTSARTYPDTRHEDIAAAARDVLADYATIDPTFALPDPSTLDDPPTAHRAQALLHYLTHSFRPFELYSATPAADTPMAEVLDTVEQLLSYQPSVPSQPQAGRGRSPGTSSGDVHL